MSAAVERRDVLIVGFALVFFAGFVLGAHAWRSKYYALRNEAIALRNASLALSRRAQRFSAVPNCVLEEWSVTQVTPK